MKKGHILLFLFCWSSSFVFGTSEESKREESEKSHFLGDMQKSLTRLFEGFDKKMEEVFKQAAKDSQASGQYSFSGGIIQEWQEDENFIVLSTPLSNAQVQVEVKRQGQSLYMQKEERQNFSETTSHGTTSSSSTSMMSQTIPLPPECEIEGGPLSDLVQIKKRNFFIVKLKKKVSGQPCGLKPFKLEGVAISDEKHLTSPVKKRPLPPTGSTPTI